MVDAVTWSASILTHDASKRRDVTAALISFRGVARHLKVGEWSCDLAPSVWPQLIELWLNRPDQTPPVFAVRWSDATRGIILSGPIRTAELARTGGDDVVRLAGVDEWGWLFRRRVYPQPADAAPWTTNTYHTLSGQASAVVAQLIGSHIGTLARSERQMDGLTVVDGGVGTTGTWKYRLTDLAEAVEDIATQAGLTIDVRRTLTNAIVVTVGAPRDRTNLLLDDSKLDDYSLILSAATGTTAIAAGSGEGTARLFAMAGDFVSGAARYETFTDQRNIDSQPTLQRAADAHRAANAAATTLSGSLTVEAADRYTWRQHYDLGDMISLLMSGTRWEAIVSAVGITIDDAGLQIVPVFGFTPRHALAQLLRDVDGLADRLNTLEIS